MVEAPPSSATPVRIRRLLADDWPTVRAIYAEGIATGHATFERETPSWERFDAGKLAVGRLVAVDDDDAVLGWTAVSPTSLRPVYSGVVEHSVYVAAGARRRGIGRALLAALIIECDAAGVWTIQSSIFEENEASMALHLDLGFRIVGRRERIARMPIGPWAGRWRDTILIERRVADDPTER